MTGSAQWILLVAGLVVLARSGSALRCWDCSSNVNAMCRDSLNVSDHQALFHTRECQPSPYQNPKPVCRKLVKKEYGERIVVRSCSIPSVDEIDTRDGTCSPTMNTGATTIESCHICSTDLCNSASTGSSSLQLLMAAGIGMLACRFFTA